MMWFKNLLFSNSVSGRIFLLMLVLTQIWKGIYPAMTDVRSDFPNYYVSSKLLLEGKDLSGLYSNKTFNDLIHSYGIDQEGKFAPFPPPTAFIMLPVAGFQPITAKRIWTCINILLLCGVIVLFSNISKLNLLQSASIVLLSGVALFNNFYLGQVYLLVLLMWMFAWLQAEKRSGWSGLLLAFGIGIKYFPIVTLPAFLIRKNFKVIVATGISLVGIIGLSIIIIGIKPCNDFINSVLFDHLNGKLEGQSSYAFAFQSWNSLALNLFSIDPIINPHPVFHWENGVLILKAIIFLGLISTLFYTLYKLRNHENLAAYSIVFLSLFTLAFSPASASYHLLLLLFPVALLIGLQKENERFIAFLICSLFVFGFSGIVFDFVNSKIHFLPFQFYRLILLNLFFVITAFQMLITDKPSIHRKENTG